MHYGTIVVGVNGYKQIPTTKMKGSDIDMMKNNCFNRRNRKLDMYSECDKSCKNCANRKADSDGHLINECGHKWTLREYFSYGSKQEIIDCLKSLGYSSIYDVLDNLDTEI